MRRLIDDQLLQWKHAKRRKPLILRGGRQIGKTWTVEKFGKSHFNSTLKLDLEKRADLHGLFAGDLGSKAILSQLAIVFGQHIRPGETLLFFDEIQACPRALVALRYLYEEIPELHVLAAGSLLEFALSDISFPVGRVQFLNMYPMTFAEFVLAGGNDQLFEILQQPPSLLSETIHTLLIKQLRDYFFVGGMPEAVQAYYDGGSMLDAFDVQSEILDSYRQDFAKYAPRADKVCLDQVLSNCATKVGDQIKYSHLAEGYSNPTIRKAFELLCMAKVLHKITSVKTVGLPLGASVNSKRFKVSLIDIGLMQRLSHLPVNVEIQQADLLAIYRGKLAEQFVAQELLAVQNNALYYWAREARGSAAEVDYLFQDEGQIYPVEVKSGKGGSLRSMHLMLNNYPDCPEGLVLYSGPYAKRADQKLRFIPIYYAGSLSERKKQNTSQAKTS
ncbi:MAG: AAA family ATPase [Pseudomonadales bacterium]